MVSDPSDKLVEVSSVKHCKETLQEDASRMNRGEGGGANVTMQKIVQNGRTSPLHEVEAQGENGEEEMFEKHQLNLTPTVNGDPEPTGLTNGGLEHIRIDSIFSNDESSSSAAVDFFDMPSEYGEELEDPQEPISAKEFLQRELELNRVCKEVVDEITDQVVSGDFEDCEHATTSSPCCATPLFLSTLDREECMEKLTCENTGNVFMVPGVGIDVRGMGQKFLQDCKMGISNKLSIPVKKNQVVYMEMPIRSPNGNNNLQQEMSESNQSDTESMAVDSFQDDRQRDDPSVGDGSNDVTLEPMEIDISDDDESRGKENLDANLTIIKVNGNSTNESEDQEKNKNDGEQADSDEDRPTIFVRNFAEISEQQSDDEEDDVVILDPSPKKKRYGDEEEAARTTPAFKTYQRKSAPAKKPGLAFITFDDSTTTVEMTSEDKIDAVIADSINQKQERRDVVREGAFALRKALIERKKLRQQRTNTSIMQAPITMTPSRPRMSHPPPIHVTRPRGPGPVYVQPSAQNMYQRVPMPGLAPISIINPTGTTNVTLPTASVSQYQQANTFTQVSSASTLPRVASNVNANNQPANVPGIQQLGSQLFFDSSKGLLYTLPSVNQGVPQQQSTQQTNNIQQHQPNATNAIRSQNGMNMCYNPRQPVLLGTTSLGQQIITFPPGLQITPQMQQMPQPVRHQPPPPPVRVRQPIPQPRQVINPRLQRPPFPIQNSAVRPNQIIMPNQTRLQRPPTQQVNIPTSVSQMQYPGRRLPTPPPPQCMPLPKIVQNSQRSLAAALSNKTVLTNSMQKMNSAQNVQPRKPASNPITGNASSDTGLTAGTQRPIPGTVEESESEPQNKTFPSLVVHVKTCLRIKPSRQMHSKSRSDLDAKVKSVLVHSPAKFVEWMMRRGLLKLEHRCIYPHHQALKLGMYSDDSRQPFSGGYVWTAECCPERQVSIFNGSIFEGSKYPPGTVLKLVYHWSCQTPANSILQWVKVTSFYLKNFFTLLRAICISWLHEHCPLLGGETKFVEIGVITLGSSAETSRGVKSVNVEILGVFDPTTKIVRMKVINSLQGLSKDKGKLGANEQGARAFQILWPLTHWVDKRSTLLVDGIIDKTLFHELGFKNIQQCGENAPKNAPTNCNVMNYLRQIVPKMFASTLSVLSKSIVQQFLDELSWREIYGSTVLQNFENILDHIGGMTKWNLPGGLIPRLNKVSQNPFADWSFTKQARRSPLNTIPITLRNEAGIKECIQYILKDEASAQTPTPSPPAPPAPPPPPPPVVVQQAAAVPVAKIPPPKPLTPLLPASAEKRKLQDFALSRQSRIAYYHKTPKQVSLEKYYYGISTIRTTKSWSAIPFTTNKCPLCVRTFSSSREIIRHIAAHVSNLPKPPENSLCMCCLKSVQSTAEHRKDVHELTDVLYACHFCQIPFQNEMDLTIHMWDTHVEAEAPYVCDICDYASSFHYDVIDHFSERHGESSYVMCPYCLKVLAAKSCSLLKTIVVHLQSHQLKRTKKCPKCVLSFGNDIDLRNHMSAHASKSHLGNAWLRSTRPFPVKVIMPTPPTAKAAPPVNIPDVPSAQRSRKRKLNTEKKKQPEAKSTLNTPFSVPLPIDPSEKFAGARFKINIPRIDKGKAICSECKVDITTPNHFIGRISCTKCRFTTSCRQAMDIHHDINHQPNSKPPTKPILMTNKEKLMNEPLVCSCGYLSRSAYKLSEHLVRCEKYTAYPKNRTPLYTEVMGSDVPPSLPIQQRNSVEGIQGATGKVGEGKSSDKNSESVPYSMNTSFEALSLPPVLSPSAPMPDSPFGEISGFEENVNALLENLL